MIDWWGPILVEYYAGTEGIGADVRRLARVAGASRHGRARPRRVRSRSCDEHGEELPPGAIGQVYFAGGTAVLVPQRPDQDRRPLTTQGWSTLGDIGYVDTEGYLYLTDRKAYMIISGGVNIYPQEAENVLVTHPRWSTSRCSAFPNEEMGEEVKAVVQPLDLADAGPELGAELLAFCRDAAVAYQMSALDRLRCRAAAHTHRASSYKRVLRDRYWQRSA